MPGITVVSADFAGGAQLGGGQDVMTVGGQIVVVQGDPVEPHGPPPHDSPYMVEGCAWFTINGIPVCRAGHLASCGHGTTGRDWFDVEG